MLQIKNTISLEIYKIGVYDSFHESSNQKGNRPCRQQSGPCQTAQPYAAGAGKADQGRRNFA